MKKSINVHPQTSGTSRIPRYTCFLFVSVCVNRKQNQNKIKACTFLSSLQLKKPVKASKRLQKGNKKAPLSRPKPTKISIGLRPNYQYFLLISTKSVQLILDPRVLLATQAGKAGNELKISFEPAKGKMSSPNQNGIIPGVSTINLQDMPIEVFLKIFGYLDTKNLFKCNQVCKRFKSICCDELLWKKNIRTFY